MVANLLSDSVHIRTLIPWPQVLELLGCWEDQRLANNLKVKPKLRKCIILKCRMNLMVVLCLSVKNCQGSAISCGLVSTSREFHPIPVMFAASYFLLIEI